MACEFLLSTDSLIKYFSLINIFRIPNFERTGYKNNLFNVFLRHQKECFEEISNYTNGFYR
jgi:hypothetical protein